MNYQLLERTYGKFNRLNLLTSQLLVYDFGYTDQRKMDFPHAHPFHEFYFILHGTACFEIDDRRCLLQTDDLLYVAPGSKHCYIPERSENCGYVNVAFDFSFHTGKDSGALNQFNDIPECVDDEQFLIENLLRHGTRHVKDTCGCRREIENMVVCIEKTFLGDVIRLFAYESCFFICAFQNFSEVRMRPDFPLVDRNIHGRVATKPIQIAEHIWDHCEEDISIEQVAHDLSYSKRSIQRILSDYYSVDFSTLLSHYRIARLKTALRNRTDTLESFSERCGYSNTRGLSRQFQAITGITVEQFKQDLKHRER